MVEQPTVTSKTCSRCRMQKPASEFDRYKRTADGLQSQCKACMKVMPTNLVPPNLLLLMTKDKRETTLGWLDACHLTCYAGCTHAGS